MIFTVYAIESLKDGRIYVGFSMNLTRRLKEHNSGFVSSTKGYRPWRVFHTEDVEGREYARKKEKYLKSGFGKEFLKSIK